MVGGGWGEGGAGRVADGSPSSSTEGKNTWSCSYLRGAVPCKRAECDDTHSQIAFSVPWGIYVFCVNLSTNSDYFPVQH